MSFCIFCVDPKVLSSGNSDFYDTLPIPKSHPLEINNSPKVCFLSFWVFFPQTKLNKLFFCKKNMVADRRLGSVLINAEVPRVSQTVPWHSQTHNSDVFMLWCLPQFEIGFENGLFEAGMVPDFGSFILKNQEIIVHVLDCTPKMTPLLSLLARMVFIMMIFNSFRICGKCYVD